MTEQELKPCNLADKLSHAKSIGENVNLLHTVINEKIRVSTAYIHREIYGGFIETWIFSDCKSQRNVQVFHKGLRSAIKAHTHIVKNLNTRPDKQGETCT